MSGRLPLVDIIVTTYPKNKARVELAEKSLVGLIETTENNPVRITLVVDGPGEKLSPELRAPFSHCHRVLLHQENFGLGPSVNEALSLIQAENVWHEQRGETEQVAPLVCYLQDDVAYSPGWLTKLVTTFLRFESALRLGFATGIECPEHAVKKEIGTFAGQRVLTKDWVRMTCLLARREYWMSMVPINGMDPETRQKRARPNDGIGSGCDWWFIRNHPNSVCKTGRTNLVLPGLLTHMGYRDSTWLSRELPESDADLRSMGEK